MIRLRERSASEPEPGATFWREAGWIENDAVCRGAHFRLV